LASVTKPETDMSNKSLAQLEIGSPEWTAKRNELYGARQNPTRREPPPDALGLGMIALAAGVAVLGLMRLCAAVGRR
jgi:hypothetical protein